MTIRFLNRRLQFSLHTLFAVTTAVAVFLGISPMIRREWALQELSNKDVQVAGTYVGLWVDIQSPAAERLKRSGASANWVLESALGDPEKFAAAHILLSEINQRRGLLDLGYVDTATHWNEMQISLYADGRVDFHKEQIPKLQEYWRKRLANKKVAND
jgi:hypothetical protein